MAEPVAASTLTSTLTFIGTPKTGHKPI
jgi:hypothetical protein